MTNESEVSDMHKSESEAVYDDDARPPSRKRSRKRKKSIYKPLGNKNVFDLYMKLHLYFHFSGTDGILHGRRQR